MKFELTISINRNRIKPHLLLVSRSSTLIKHRTKHSILSCKRRAFFFGCDELAKDIGFDVASTDKTKCLVWWPNRMLSSGNAQILAQKHRDS
jgi:hypothetical protein